MFNARVLITSTALLIASPAGAQNPGINCKPSMPAQCAPDENGKERFVCHVRITCRRKSSKFRLQIA